MPEEFEKQWIYQKCTVCHGDGVLHRSGLLDGVEVIAEEFQCMNCVGKGEIKWGFIKVLIST